MATTFATTANGDAVTSNEVFFYTDDFGPVAGAVAPDPQVPGDSPYLAPVVDPTAYRTAAYLSPWRVVHKRHDGGALGEAAPDDLRFGKYINRPGYTNYNIPYFLDGGRQELSLEANTEPDRTDYEILYGSFIVHEGMHVSIDVDSDNEYLAVAGNGFLHALESLFLPFDPNDPLKYNINSQVNEDLFHLIQRVLNSALSQEDAIKLYYSNFPDSGIIDEQHILSGNFETVYAIIDRLSGTYPGFDFDIQDQTRQIRLWTPKKGVQNPLILEQGRNIKGIHYSNNGVEATEVWGTGSGTSNTRLISQQENSVAKAIYRLKQKQLDVGDVAVRTLLNKLTKLELAKSSAPAEQIWVTMRPDRDDNIWSMVEAGDSVRIRADLRYKQLDDWYRITGLEGYVDREGNQQAVFTFGDNQGAF